MTPAADTFARFVDSLAQHLDDHEATAVELAGRLYLSRFHFDRVVSAASGESPTRFRRRVLLERAAFRLVASDAGILDIAVEAGYSSNEAFTRAFQRAYGLPPSVWRAAPTQIRLAAPNGVHFQPPGSIRLPARTKVTSMDLVTTMVGHHVWLVGELVDRADVLTDDQLDAPVRVSVDNEDGRMTLRTLLSRLVGQMDMWLCALDSRAYDWALEDGESVASMRDRLTEVGPRYLAEVTEVAQQGRLDETFVDALCEPAEVFTYGGVVAHVLTFAAYHRTLAVQALAANGVEDLGWGDPMRWVAEPAEA